MKLTKRGKKLRAATLIFLIWLAVEGVRFVATHHIEKYNCHLVPEGWLCDTKWVKN